MNKVILFTHHSRKYQANQISEVYRRCSCGRANIATLNIEIQRIHKNLWSWYKSLWERVARRSRVKKILVFVYRSIILHSVILIISRIFYTAPLDTSLHQITFSNGNAVGLCCNLLNYFIPNQELVLPEPRRCFYKSSNQLCTWN